MYCKNCGTEFKNENKFCTNCGYDRHNQHKDHKPDKVVEKEKFKQKITDVSKWKAIATIIGVIALVLILALLLSNLTKKNNKINSNSQSVVNIVCDNKSGGSGTIFSKDGIVFTNEHVVNGATSCLVTIPDIITGKTKEIYEATPIIIPKLSKKYDIAGLQINSPYTDTNGKIWGVFSNTFLPFVLPSTCDTKKPSQLGDLVKIYGYPVTSGGYNLTITDGVISSFADDGNILTSAQIDSGNSGGLAIDQDGCWLGIPSAVVSGNYQSLGVIIPSSVVVEFLGLIPSNFDNSISETDTTKIIPEKTNNMVCKDKYGQHSYSTGEKNSTGGQVCDCQSGYVWDTAQTACVTAPPPQKTGYEICQDRNGYYATYDSTSNSCGCASGYYLGSISQQCVSLIESRNQVCEAKFPGTSYLKPDPVDGHYICDCKSGYDWGNDRTACYTTSSFTQSCINSYGQGAYSTTENGKRVCDCGYGYDWNPQRNMCVTTASINQICERDVGRNSVYAGSSSNGSYDCTRPY